jgi:hypothetical protein
LNKKMTILLTLLPVPVAAEEEGSAVEEGRADEAVWSRKIWPPSSTFVAWAS